MNRSLKGLGFILFIAGSLTWKILGVGQEKTRENEVTLPENNIVNVLAKEKKDRLSRLKVNGERLLASNGTSEEVSEEEDLNFPSKKKKKEKDKKKRKDKKSRSQKRKSLSSSKKGESKNNTESESDEKSTQTYGITSQLSRLPSNNIELSENTTDPLEEKNKGTEQETSNGKNSLGENIFVTSRKEKTTFSLAEEEVVLFLDVKKGNGDHIEDAEIKASVFNEDGHLVSDILYLKDSDGESYRANYSPKEESNESTGDFLVKISVSETGKELNPTKLIETFSVNYRKSLFKKRVKSFVNDKKNLEVQAKYQVLEDGIYIIEGTLYDQSNRPIAYGEGIKQLTKKTQWVSLEFHGFLFYDRKANGPFYLKNVSLSFVKPNLTTESGRVDSPNHKTMPYKYSDFNNQPFVNITIQEKMKSLTHN